MGRYGYNVIDADGHVLEPEEIWERFLDSPYRNWRPRLIADNRRIPWYL